MPVAQFAGDRNWGYDAVYPSPCRTATAGRAALQRLVDAAHQAGLAVILDVVYNHLGPEGNYLARFGPYFTDRYRTPWGEAVNYDGPQSDAVRQFVVDNARMWVRDFHLDGLRLDAVQTIYDFSPRHILAEIHVAVQHEAARAGRPVHVIAESNQNDVRLVRPPRRGGYGLDGVWSDDFHHAVHALLTGERDGYYMDFGRPEQSGQGPRRGVRVRRLLQRLSPPPPRQPRGRDRPHAVRRSASRTTIRWATGPWATAWARSCRPPRCGWPAALLLLSPCVPLLFMGEEYGERRPFPFFCSFDDPAVVEAVRRGRRQEFAALDFRWGVDIPDPQDCQTFAAAKLGWAWPEGSAEAQLRQLYQDLLAARRRWPALRDRRHTTARVWTDPRSTDSECRPALLLLQRGGDDGLLAVANLTPQNLSIAALNLDGRQLLLSTEDARYGGERDVSGTLRVPPSAIGTRSVPDTTPLPKGEGTPSEAHGSKLESSKLTHSAPRAAGLRPKRRAAVSDLSAWAQWLTQAVAQTVDSRRCRPTATYRLQFEPGKLTFRDAAGIVPYLAELGVSHLYASPCLKARAGSATRLCHRRLRATRIPSWAARRIIGPWSKPCTAAAMGQILDVVPQSHERHPRRKPVVDRRAGERARLAARRLLRHRLAPRQRGAARPDPAAHPGRPVWAGPRIGRVEAGVSGGAPSSCDIFRPLLPIDPRTYRAVLTHRLDALKESQPAGFRGTPRIGEHRHGPGAPARTHANRPRQRRRAAAREGSDQGPASHADRSRGGRRRVHSPQRAGVQRHARRPAQLRRPRQAARCPGLSALALEGRRRRDQLSTFLRHQRAGGRLHGGARGLRGKPPPGVRPAGPRRRGWAADRSHRRAVRADRSTCGDCSGATCWPWAGRRWTSDGRKHDGDGRRATGGNAGPVVRRRRPAAVGRRRAGVPARRDRHDLHRPPSAAALRGGGKDPRRR